MIDPIVFYTVKDFFLLDAINQKLDMIKASGLVEFWNSQAIDRKSSKINFENSPKVFTLNQFTGSFQVLLYGLSVSLAVFVVECLKFCFQ
jgi:hypothetical protein